jgi:hypothetical protein
MASGSTGLQLYFSIAKKYLALESSAAASPMSYRPLSRFRRLINLSIPSKHSASRCAEAPLKSRPGVEILARIMKIMQ